MISLLLQAEADTRVEVEVAIKEEEAMGEDTRVVEEEAIKEDTAVAEDTAADKVSVSTYTLHPKMALNMLRQGGGYQGGY